ncbi:uncharacterized protein Bfra_004780 [Botrytis fragariae]|uniref:Uncharacterized protein n=1 Tax=Botrytis fragariae TaxID=1964551 RepID=A0A8H6AWB0_9HELO|nr:uncharacterized protein Bfra_004780 [Botrytis fragariae]KAF5874762.1 hypothetical protein Bfra_004780 [Botrytis fragariae]
MNNGNGSAVIFHDIEELLSTRVEEEHSHIALQGDQDFDDPPIADTALEEPIIDDPPVELPLLQLRPQPQPQSFRYSNIITLIQIIELIALIAVVLFLLFDYFSPKPTPTQTIPPPLTPAGW